MNERRPWGAAAASLALLLGTVGLTGCDEPCCTFDGRPVPLAQAPGGALVGVARATAVQGGEPFSLVVDTASPLTILERPAGTPPSAEVHSLKLLGALCATGGAEPSTCPAEELPTRAYLNELTVIPAPLGALGQGDGGPLWRPGGILGGNVLRNFAVSFSFSPTPSFTLWPRWPADNGFLTDQGYAVLGFDLYGGGRLNALGDDNLLGGRDQVTYPPTRVLFRACAAPAPFAPEMPREARCCRGDEYDLATGADLALVLGTGYGPLILSESAWNRVRASSPDLPDAIPGPALYWPLARRADNPDGLVQALWGTLPRLALVDLEVGVSGDPGACVELGRARRMEQVAWRQVHEPEAQACVRPCDGDRRNPRRALAGAAYVELGGDLRVAVVSDLEPILQGIRFDVRPEGPEVDGIVGAETLRAVRLDLDYTLRPGRAIFACTAGTQRTSALGEPSCHVSPRCPKAGNDQSLRRCFGLPPHGPGEACQEEEAC